MDDDTFSTIREDKKVKFTESERNGTFQRLGMIGSGRC